MHSQNIGRCSLKNSSPTASRLMNALVHTLIVFPAVDNLNPVNVHLRIGNHLAKANQVGPLIDNAVNSYCTRRIVGVPVSSVMSVQSCQASNGMPVDNGRNLSREPDLARFFTATSPVHNLPNAPHTTLRGVETRSDG